VLPACALADGTGAVLADPVDRLRVRPADGRQRLDALELPVDVDVDRAPCGTDAVPTGSV
jgi:hypothetical protein